MSSCLPFVLASSSLNLDGRAPTIHSDESFTATQMDGLLPITHIDELFTAVQKNELLPTIHIDKLFPQHRWTSSCLLFVLASSSLNLDGRAPTIHSDESFTATQMDGLLPIIHIDELLPSTQKDELLLFTLTSSSLNSDFVFYK